MTQRRPLVHIAGQLKELPIGDTIIGATSSGSVSLVKTFNLFGTLTPTIGIARFYPERDITLTGVYLSIGIAASSDIVVSVLKNGAEIANVVLTTGSYRTNLQSLSNMPLTTTDYVTVDLVSGSSGSNLSTNLVLN